MRKHESRSPRGLEIADASLLGDAGTPRGARRPARARAEAETVDEDAIVAKATAILQRRLERGAAMTDPLIAGQYCAGQLRSLEREVFAAMFLDNRHRLIAFEVLFTGTVDGAEVYPREVARAALRHNAVALIIAHNHPSGSSEPSAADRAVTLRLRDALALLEIRLLDHFVIGDGPATSLAARGWV